MIHDSPKTQRNRFSEKKKNQSRDCNLGENNKPITIGLFLYVVVYIVYVTREQFRGEGLVFLLVKTIVIHLCMSHFISFTRANTTNPYRT